MMTSPRSRRRRLLSLLTLRCAGASELISRRLDEPLPLVDRLALAGHLLACAPCRRFARQVRFLREACARRPGDEPDASEADILSREARARILEALRRARDN
ncbi:zf-HC2 domain-containing protein [Aquisphaera insulae]|uniref:anti-sigma factor family protein n=1 Tax=Aquisphaera insulae TaxID=2712864 RepID=UPI00196A2A6C|nr:zf-HC2 domain-containing protein [Aquisphaera insulae]